MLQYKICLCWRPHTGVFNIRGWDYLLAAMFVRSKVPTLVLGANVPTTLVNVGLFYDLKASNIVGQCEPFPLCNHFTSMFCFVKRDLEDRLTSARGYGRKQQLLQDPSPSIAILVGGFKDVGYLKPQISTIPMDTSCWFQNTSFQVGGSTIGYFMFRLIPKLMCFLVGWVTWKGLSVPGARDPLWTILYQAIGYVYQNSQLSYSTMSQLGDSVEI